ncbi:MAG TPA: GNAT family N-acetyltransferase [Thermoanaerobaculia bacterium]|jgi:predicted GNAT family acetyltransferase|nr:GNAT family N-acetyltransferase [Thermoanaerobaculia bacterium]
MSLEVRNDETQHKFIAVVDGHEAHIEYAHSGDVYNLMHTFVPEELRGHGVAEDLVQASLDQIKTQGAKFFPTCPFVQAFLKRHPEYREGMAHHHV